ncbi:MAG: hypothetical protein LBW85_01200 [Deltaproteobacteria bacterium]|nr:hypothetical protein [Deltaproteobacteria bacterium]
MARRYFLWGNRARRPDLGIPYGAVAAGESAGFLVLPDGAVLSCGYNRHGQLGRAAANGTASAPNLAPAPGLPPVRSVCTGGGGEGETNVYFLTQAGEVWSCGGNWYGQLARAVQTVQGPATNLGRIPGLPPVKRIVANPSSVFFVTESGLFYSAGDNSTGALGRTAASGEEARPNLGLVADLQGIADVASSGGSTWFLLENGQVWSCGMNPVGQLGRPGVGSYTPGVQNLGRIGGLPRIVQIACVGDSAHFLDEDGRVWNCGSNFMGQLGRAVDTPMMWSGDTNLGRLTIAGGRVKRIVAARVSTYFILESGSVASCGNNDYGVLGRSVRNGRYDLPNVGTVSGVGPVRDVATSRPGSHAYFLAEDGSAHSCGNNDRGMMARDVPTPQTGMDGVVPTNLGQVPGLSGVDAVAASASGNVYFHTSDGRFWSAGDNGYGQLGRAVASAEPGSSNLGQVPL